MKKIYPNLLKILIRLSVVIAIPTLILILVGLIPLSVVCFLLMVIFYVFTGKWYIKLHYGWFFPIVLIMSIDDWSTKMFYRIDEKYKE